MALDESSDEVVLFGGFTMEGPVLGDTWTFGVQTDQAPFAVISSPASGGTYRVGERVGVIFSCEAAPDGPPVASCEGSDGTTGLGLTNGFLDTSRPGKRTYSVVATATDGQTGSASISYEVIKPKPVCGKVEGGLSLETFGLVPPLGDAPPVAGLRIRLGARGTVDARLSPSISYRTRSGSRSVKLRTRTVRINGSRKLRFRIPDEVRSGLRRDTGAVFGNRVIFRLSASLKSAGDRSDCFRRTESRSLQVRVVNVSSRVALRRR